MKKLIYKIPVLICLLAGFAVGYRVKESQPLKAHRVLYYVDPMHPSYRSNKPGIAPDCGMELVPVYAEDAAKSIPGSSQANGGTSIDPAVRRLYGIKLAKVERDLGQQSLRLFARVEADETRIYRIDFGTDGFVKEDHGDAVGTHVTKNQRLASVYSPDFLAVAGGYLAANEHSPGAPNTAKDNYNTSTTSQGGASVLARADRLRNLGMSDAQIDEISQTHKLPEDVYIVSPTDGFILARNISQGMRFERHTELYTIADLSKVWVTAEAFGRDAEAVRPGAIAVVTIPDTKERIRATVTAILPEADPVTHAVKVRLEAQNSGFRLRPKMFVNVELPVSYPAGLSVPADAVLDSGLTRRVFVQSAENQFEPRVIETGWQVGDRMEVVKGLREGDVIVSSGTFLVDSESKLHSNQHAENSVKDVPPMDAAMEHRMN